MHLLLIFGLMAFSLSDWLERFFVYYPERRILQTPAQARLPYQEAAFETASGRKIHGWWLPHPDLKTAILFFHGNAGNISHRLDKLALFSRAGFSTLIFDYGGFGKSEGSPSEQNLYQDGKAAYDYAVKTLKVAPENLVFYGESLGCAVAIELAAREPNGGLILESPFLSLREMAKAHYPLFSSLAGDKFDNAKKIGGIKTPKLFIHPKQDEIVPFDQGLKLYETAPPPKQHLWMERGDHNSAFLTNAEAYLEAIRRFPSKSPPH